jgi:2-polyprenyl-3-methyl-5-hydroxy-6-metoxy-1,4-benzoquinol methylase
MKDVFGKILLDVYHGKKAKCVIERDDSYKDLSSSKEYFYPYAKWPDTEKEAMKCVKGRVLDLGLGAGRHSLYLQNKGFKVTGIDISPGAIEVSRKQGVKDVRFMSITNLRFKKEKFDTVIMMCNNFGLAGSFEGTKKLLKNLHKITSKNAVIIASSMNYTATNNMAHLRYQQKYRRKHRYGLAARIRHLYKKEKSEWFNLFMLAPMEVLEVVEGTGWYVDKVLSGLHVNPRKWWVEFSYIIRKR